MSMKILVLDDDQYRHNSFAKWFEGNYTATYTAQETIDKLNSEEFDYIFLDHDLGGAVYVNEQDTNTGSEVVRHLVKPEMVEKFKNTIFYVHSMNEPAARNMRINLQRAGWRYSSTTLPFYLMNEKNIGDFYQRLKQGQIK